MKYVRVVVRFAVASRETLDRLSARYLEENGRGLSRAAVVRVLVERALAGKDVQRATEVLGQPERALAPRAVKSPAAKVASTEEQAPSAPAP